MAKYLTDKQEKFVQELIKGKSQREAYKIAYLKCKAKDKTIDEMASKLFNNHKVYTRYNELRDRLVKEAEDECIMSAKEILKEFESIARDDVSNYLSFRTEKTVVDYDDNGNPIIDYTNVVELKDSRTINTRNISQISLGKNGDFKFKLYPRDNALIQLAKHKGLFNDKEALELKRQELELKGW